MKAVIESAWGKFGLALIIVSLMALVNQALTT